MKAFARMRFVMSHDARTPRPATIPLAAKAQLRFLYLAKHASGNGSPDRIDGNHAIYHHEMRTTLESIGLNLVTAQGFEAIERKPEVDFVIPLLNRAGFQNSEMLGPLLLTRHGIPFLGASPILRGVADDKHLMKALAKARGVPTSEWAIHRSAAGAVAAPHFAFEKLVVKPNASSASWGIGVFENWRDAREHVVDLNEQGHDVIMEPWTPLIDVAVPVIGGRGAQPWLLPAMAYMPEDPRHLRSYSEKRALIATDDDPLAPVEDPELVRRLESHTRELAAELWPFDYGRFEFRYDPASGELRFMEVNLSCNLWSKKTISRSAAQIGIDHSALVESIVAHSIARQGLLLPFLSRAAA